MRHLLPEYAGGRGLLRLTAHVFAAAIGLGFLVFCQRLYVARMRIRRLQTKHGITIIPHSFIFGHFISMIKAMKKHNIPLDLDGVYNMCVVVAEYPEIAATGVLYLDLWPLVPQLMSITNPDMSTQITIAPNLPKHHHFQQYHIGTLTKGIDMLSSNGDLWRNLRSVYSTGFSAKNISSMAPWFMEEINVFKRRLFDAADTGEPIELEAYCLDLTLDVIARTAFNIRTRVQEGCQPAWIPALREIMSLMSFNNDPTKTWYPPAIYRKWRSNAILQREFTQIILSTSQKQSTGSDGPKTLIGLAVKQYVEAGEEIPEDVLDSIVQNIKIFLVAGHETTGTTLTRLLYFLSEYPDKLALVRAEHDAVLGHDPDTAAEAILTNYSILNKLTYTIAAIKETLRLFPPVSGSVREATSPDFELVNRETGQHFPTHGFILNPSALTMSSDERFWYKPLDFIPERFLVQDEKHPLYPHKNAFQPFSLGPRICIGQEMVQLEVRMAVALLIRDLDFVAQYSANAPTFRGHPAYAATSAETTGVARTKDNLPVKVLRRVVEKTQKGEY